jgi:hypothetical protein
MFQLTQQSDVLQPAQALFDALALLLTDGVAGCRVVRASMSLPPGLPVFRATCGVTFM